MENKDTYIYKYCSFDAAEKIVKTQSLRFNNPSKFNDPFDCDINLLDFDFSDCCDEVLNDIEESIEIAKENFRYYPKDFVNKLLNATLTNGFKQNNFKNSVLTKISKSVICCFSLDYSNSTMWSHYAESHKGVCFIFDFEVTDRFIDKEINKKISSRIVEYKELKLINYLKDKKKGINNLFFTKSTDWSYEKEVRLLILNKNIEDIKFNKSFLKGIVFGANVTNENIEKLKSIIQNLSYPEFHFGKFIKNKLKLKLVWI